MDVSFRLPRPGQAPVAAGSPAPVAAGRDFGLLLARLSVAPALGMAAFLLVSFPLLAAGWFRPVPVIGLSVIAAAVMVSLGLRALPGLRPDPAVADLRWWAQPGDPPDGPGQRRTPWWAACAVPAIALAFFAFQAAYHSQFILVARDPGAYMQFAAWIAGHGRLPIPTGLAAFGGAQGISFSGPAMYQVGAVIVPQFMAGLPMSLAVGFWLRGVDGALLLAPLFGATAVVAFGGLAARLAGARWAPLAAGIYAVSEPLMFTSRSTYTEPLAATVFLGGLCLVIDSLRAGAPGWRQHPGAASRNGARVLALLGGLVLGIAMLVRIDAPADALPVILYAGLLLVRRQRQAVPLIAGLAVGWAWGWWDAVFLSFPYVFQTNRSSSVPMIAITVAVVVVTAVGVLWLRRRVRVTGSMPQVGDHWYLPRWLPAAAAIMPLDVLVTFAMTARLHPDYARTDYVQLAPYWVYWYIGSPAIAAAAAGAAVLTYGCLRGRWPALALPLMMFCWAIVLFLYRPGITPDQPWASRRLVPMVLPGFILLAVWAVAWACGRLHRAGAPLRDDGPGRDDGPAPPLAGWPARRRRLAATGRSTAAAQAAASCAVLLLVPAALGARGTAFQRTYTGEVAAVRELCGQIPADASVVTIDAWTVGLWSAAVRDMCGVPVAGFKDGAVPTALADRAIADIRRAGRVPVLLAETEQELAPFADDGPVTEVVDVNSTRDGLYLLSGPAGIARQELSVYLWKPGPALHPAHGRARSARAAGQARGQASG